MYQCISSQCLSGLGLLLLLLPINAIVWTYMEKYQFSQMKKKDERVRIIAEILSGIKVIKLFGWELSFIKKINEIRKEEIDQLRIFQYLEATQFFAWTSAPLLGFYIMYKFFLAFSFCRSKINLDYLSCFRRVQIVLVRSKPFLVGPNNFG